MDALRKRLRRDDEAILNLADALLTFILLAIAAFILWRGSLAPAEAGEDAASAVAQSQVMAMATALLRLTIDDVDLMGSGSPRSESVPTVLTYMLDESREQGGRPLSAFQPYAERVIDNASHLALDRWTIRLDVTDPADATRAICLQHDPASAPGPDRPVVLGEGRCETPPGRVTTQLARLPSGYDTILYAKQEVDR